jgi:hypothetical protein
MPPGPLVASAVVSAETSTQLLAPEVVKPIVPSAAVPAETRSPPEPAEIVKPLTTDLRRLNVTVTAEFIAELEQVRVALSHKCPDGNFEQVVREAFKLVLERDRKRKALTDRPRAPTDQPRAPTDRPRAPTEISGANDRCVAAAIKRAVWQRDQARCTWPMGDGEVCGSTHRLEFDHDLEVALGGKPTIGNIRLLCKNHNLMKAEQHLGRAFMAKFRKDRPADRGTS